MAQSMSVDPHSSPLLGKLTNKVAVVTGGNSGIGLSAARLFAEEGARVYITGRRQTKLDEAVELIGHGAIGVQGDVTNNEDLDRLYAKIKAEQGHIDVVFANAGNFRNNALLGDITEEHIDQSLSLHVRAVLFTVQKALPLLRDGSSIVLNASAATCKGAASLSVYAASKAAVRSFARTWTAELAHRKIRTNVVSAAFIETPLFDAAGMTTEQFDAFRDSVMPSVPLRRFGNADEVAKAVLYLASDDSTFVSGQELFVDGGFVSI
jgi:NAD(P)-dependent dehydrogenase (short-subunit alcohol dehydrogenase family)